MKKQKRTRLSKVESRDKILNTSLRLISRQGWSGLTFQKLAKSCRMSPSNIVYHFSTREDLLRALLDHISHSNWRTVQEGMTPEMNGFQRLLVHFQKNLQWATDYPSEAQVIAQIYAESGHDAEFARVFKLMFDRAQGRIRDYLLAGQREGLFQYDIQTEILARLLHNLLVGAFINSFGTRQTGQVEYAARDLESTLKILTGSQKRSG